LLGAAELTRLAPSDAEPLELEPDAAAGLRFEDAVAVIRSLDDIVGPSTSSLTLRLNGNDLAGARPGPAADRWAAAAVGELARRLSDRFRARLPLSVELPAAAVDLPALAAAGLLPVVTTADSAPLLSDQLAALALAVAEHSASSLDEFAGQRALAQAAGQPFRQRVREHAEANAGVCLRDRQWAAAWRAFEARDPSQSAVHRVRQALLDADLAPTRATEAAAEVVSACHRVNRAAYADALRAR
jgi:hypothetical protein